MSRKHRTQKEIKSILEEVEAGNPISKVIKEHKISEATYYRWKAKTAKEEKLDDKRLRLVDDENIKLKQLLADASLKVFELTEKLKNRD